jgi:hypothetical protein
MIGPQVDPVTISGLAVSLLAPYLAEAGRGAAKKAGEAAWAQAEAVIGAIRTKFSADNDSYAHETLARLEQAPDTEGRRRALADILAEKLQADPAFASKLSSLVEDASPQRSVNVSVRGDRSFGVGGNIADSTIIMGDQSSSARPERNDQKR